MKVSQQHISIIVQYDQSRLSSSLVQAADRHQVAVILPKTHRMEFLLTGSSPYRLYSASKETEKPKVIQWIDRLSARLAGGSTDDAAREDLEQICKSVIRKLKQWKNTPPPVDSWRKSAAAPFSDDVVARIVSLSVELDIETIFVAAFDFYSKEMAASAFQSVGVAVLRFGLESLLPK